MRIRRPFALELAYTREMMACLLLRSSPDWPSRVLLIGLGTGSLVKFIYHNLPHTQLTAVEIDERIVPIAKQYFHLPDDPKRLKIVIADGADYIEKTKRHYDAIFVDGFGPNARPGRLDSGYFYSECHTRLSQEGLLIINLLSRYHGFMGSIERIQQSFDQRSIVFPSLDSGNAIVFAASGETIDVNLKEMSLRAEQLKADTGLDLRPTISRLQQTQSLPNSRLLL